MTPEARYEELADRFAEVPRVTLPDQPGATGWGASTLRVGGKIFAMLHDGQLVVKLPRQRVTALVEAGHGEPFNAGRGPLKEWFSLAADAPIDWYELASEALAFVGGTG